MTTANQPTATTPLVPETWRDQIVSRYSDLGLFHSLEYDVIMAVIAEVRSTLSASCATGTFMMYAQTRIAAPTLALCFDFFGDHNRYIPNASDPEITADAIVKAKRSIGYGLELWSSTARLDSKIYSRDDNIIMATNTDCGRLLLSSAFVAHQNPENEFLSRSALLQAATAILALLRPEDHLLSLADKQQREYLTIARADIALKALRVVSQAFSLDEHPAIRAWKTARACGEVDSSRLVFR